MGSNHMMRRAADMSFVGPAATTDDPKLWQRLEEHPVEFTKFVGIPSIQFFCLIQFGMAHAAGIGANTTDATGPMPV